MTSERWAEIKKLMTEAAEHDPSTLDVWLHERCAGDEPLYAEVRSLLHEQENEGLLQVPDPERVAQFLREHRAESGVGRQIGKFKVSEVLGYGGMGVVYRAEQENPQREVALKIIPAGLHASPYQLKLFRREVFSLARMQHPGIAALYEAGIAEDGQHYFAMELVVGSPMLDHAYEQQLGVPERLALFTKICDAIHYAHQKGVIHRDIKPTNILVSEAGQPKLLDFGLAKLMQHDGATVSTAQGKVHGTLPYMSPEQARGSSSQIDVRSDVYSLGVVLFELLTQRRPFDLTQRTVPQAIDIICTQTPPKAGTIVAGLRGDLETIIAKCLEKEPERRYQSAHALIEDIERFLSKQPIAARPPSAMYQFRKFAVRHKAVVSVVAILIAVLAVSAIGGSILLIRLASERDGALAARKMEAESRQTSDEVVAFLEKLFQQSDPGQRETAEPNVRELLNTGVERLQTELADQPFVRARLATTLGSIYNALADYSQARQLVESAVAIIEQYKGEQHPDLLKPLEVLADTCTVAGSTDEAYQLEMRRLQIARAAYGLRHENTAAVLASVGATKFHAGDAAAALPYLQESHDIRRERFGNQNAKVAESLHNLGAALMGVGRLDEAAQTLETARDLKRQLLGDSHEVVVTLDMLAHLEFARNDLTRAEQYLAEEVDLCRRLYHAHHPKLAEALHDYGFIVQAAHGSEAAEPIQRETLAIRRAAFGNYHPLVAASLHDLAYDMTYRGWKEAEGAPPMLLEALEIQQNHDPVDENGVTNTMNTLAMAYTTIGRFAEAEPLQRQVLEQWIKAKGSDDPFAAVAHGNLGSTLASLGNWECALEQYHQAADIYRKHNHANLGGIYNLIGYMYLDQGDFEGAASSFRACQEDQQPHVAKGDGRRAREWIARASAGLGIALCELGCLDEAELSLRDSIEQLQELLSEDNPALIPPMTCLARLLWERRELELALPLAHQALALSRTKLRSDHPHLADALFVTGLIALENGDPEVAEPGFHEALAIRESLPVSAWSTARIKWAFGACLLRLGRWQEAKSLMVQCEGSLAAILGPTSVWTRATRRVLSDIHAAHVLDE